MQKNQMMMEMGNPGSAEFTGPIKNFLGCAMLYAGS